MKTKMYLKFLSISVLIFATGCSDIKKYFQKSDECNSEQTLSMVRTAIINNISSQIFLDEDINESIQFEFVREEAYDQKTEKRLCKATIISGSNEIPITYQTQHTEIGQSVNINGMTYLDLFKIRSVLERNNNENTTKIPPIAESKANTKSDVPPTESEMIDIENELEEEASKSQATH